MISNTVLAISENNLNIQLTTQPANRIDAVTQSDLKAGEAAKVSFKITGQYDGGAVSGLHPGAWIRPRLKNRSSCKNAVRNYLTLGPNASLDIDLNSYSFITLNQDNSIGIIDPHLNLATANLLALKKLDSKIADWHLDSAAGKLFLALPDTNKISVISALSGNLITDIDLPASPQQMLSAEQQNLLWIAGNETLMIVDTRTSKLLKTISLKAGKLHLAISQESKQLWAYAQDDGELIGVDLVSLETRWRRQLPAQLSSIIYSEHADRLYLGSHEKKEITTVYPGSDTKVETIKLRTIPNKLAIMPNGQWLFSLDFGQRQLTAIDTANNHPTHYLVFKHAFDHLVFTDQFAYLHHTTSPNISLIRLDSMNNIKPPALIEVPFGTTPPGEQPLNLPAIVPLPEGGAVVVNNAADKTLYLYMEDGMLAPANAFKVYTAAPMALLVHDKTLSENKAGLYEAVTMIPKPGEYELVFYLDSPLVVSCFPFTVSGPGTLVASVVQSPVQDIQLITSKFKVGTPAEVKIKLLTNADIGDADLQLLFFKPGSNWQKRLVAKPDAEMGYSIPITFPEAGKYLLAIQSDKLKLDFKQQKMKNHRSNTIMKNKLFSVLSAILLSVSLQNNLDSKELGESASIKLIDHEMIDTHHNTVKFVSGALAGHIIVMNFIYTDCRTVCPISSYIMKDVYKKLSVSTNLKQSIRLITLTLNPNVDTSKKMRQFSEKIGIKSDDWLWLTGHSAQMNEVLLGLRAYSADVEEHSNVILVGDAANNHWTSFFQSPSSIDIIQRINDYLENRQES